MSRIGVSIFSDDRLFREGLRPLLSSEPSLAIIDSDCTPRKIGADGADVLLVDSGTDGVLEQCAKLRADRPLLIFLSVPNDAWAVEALAAGARGIIRKEDAIADVARAIVAVNEGRVWAPRHVVVDAWLRHRRGAVPDSRAVRVEQRLSAREVEVVRHVAAGMSNKELAARLAISPATVKTHLTHIFQKLGVQGRGELTALYHGSAIVGPRKASAARLRRPA